MARRQTAGSIVLAIYLILVGLAGLVGLSFSHSGEVIGIVALVAAVLLLLGK